MNQYNSYRYFKKRKNYNNLLFISEVGKIQKGRYPSPEFFYLTMAPLETRLILQKHSAIMQFQLHSSNIKYSYSYALSRIDTSNWKTVL